MSSMSEAWFAEATRLEIGQSLLIQVLNKKEGRDLIKELNDERTGFSITQPIHASQLAMSVNRKDNRFWVVVSRKARAPLKGVIKEPDGSFREIVIDPERRRIITLMIKDGLSKEEMEETLDGLTEEEEREFFPD